LAAGWTSAKRLNFRLGNDLLFEIKAQGQMSHWAVDKFAIHASRWVQQIFSSKRRKRPRFFSQRIADAIADPLDCRIAKSSSGINECGLF